MKKYVLLIVCSLFIVTGCQNKNNDKENTTTKTTTNAKTSLVTTTSSKSNKTSESNAKEEVIKTNVVEKSTTAKKDKTSSTKLTTKTSSAYTGTSTTKNATTTTTTTTSKKITTTSTTTKSTTTTAKALSEQEVYQSMIALKSKYPNGMEWTNDNCYSWKGGIYGQGCGCAGFAFILSDAAFGTKKATKNQNYNNIKVGDIVRLYNDSHSVVILEIHDDYYILAEGNINSSIYWGRKITKDELLSAANYVLTRY